MWFEGGPAEIWRGRATVIFKRTAYRLQPGRTYTAAQVREAGFNAVPSARALASSATIEGSNFQDADTNWCAVIPVFVDAMKVNDVAAAYFGTAELSVPAGDNVVVVDVTFRRAGKLAEMRRQFELVYTLAVGHEYRIVCTPTDTGVEVRLVDDTAPENRFEPMLIAQ